MKNRKLFICLIAASFVLATVATAEMNIGFNGIGGKVGFVSPEGDFGSTFALGAVADLGTLADNLALEGDVTFWTKGEDIAGFDWNATSINIAAIVKYYFGDPTAKFVPYAGGGLGLTFTIFSYEYPDFLGGGTTKESDSDVNLGIHVVGGAKTAVSDAMDGFAEFRYSLVGDWDFWGVFVGIMYKLNK